MKLVSDEEKEKIETGGMFLREEHNVKRKEIKKWP